MYTENFHEGAAFTPTKHPEYAESYEHITTARIIESLLNEGFVVQDYKQSRCRNEGNRPYVKHAVRLLHPDAPKSAEGQKQILLTNANNKTSALTIKAGYYRFVCCNGLVIGDTLHSIKVPHRHRDGVSLLDNIIEGTFQVLKDFDKVDACIDQMQSRSLTLQEQHAFAEQAFKLRYLDKPLVDPTSLLNTRRFEDKGSTLWRVFNRLQENLLKGGFLLTVGEPNGNTKGTPKIRRARAIRGLDSNLKLNHDLWNLATDYISN